jgi:hypothetical protein
MLRVDRDRVVNGQGREVRLRGFGVGGWMNSENFINGYPGFESGLRMALADELGAAKAEFLWDRMLDYFLAEPDIAFMKECGATVVRLPLNYRHFESDSAPFQYCEKGFARLHQVIEWCRKHDLYAILDLHAVQGWQDPDWHSDHFGRLTLLWRHPHFQDRFVALWEELARRYQGDPVIAGHNVMNEPVTGAPFGFFGFKYKSDWEVLNRLNRRVVEAIRRIDPEHIIFLEGDHFSILFSGLEPPFADNLVYSSHNYIKPCFGPGKYPGSFLGGIWERAKMRLNFQEQEGTQFCRRHRVPLWVGEFGGAFDGPAEELESRLQALDDQIGVFEENSCHWTIWTYKDVGMMGLVTPAPDSDYMKAVAPILQGKQTLATDGWVANRPRTEAQQKLAEVGELILRSVPDSGVDPERFGFYLEQTALSNYVGAFLHPAWARCFTGMSEVEIDRVMQSFAFSNCRVNQGLKEILHRHLTRSDGRNHR